MTRNKPTGSHTMAKYFISTLMFHVWCCVLSQDMCCRGGVNRFQWSFDSALIPDRRDTTWTYVNGTTETIIMQNTSGVVSPSHGTPFTSRISQDPNSNAGLILKDTTDFDDGLYRVTVKFGSNSDFTDTTTLSVDDSLFVTEITSNAVTKVGGDSKNLDPWEVDSADCTTTFTFTIDSNSACIPPPSITFKDATDSDIKPVSACDDVYECIADISSTTSLYVTVDEGTMTARYPTTGTYKVNVADACGEGGAVIPSGSLLPTLMLSILVIMSSV